MTLEEYLDLVTSEYREKPNFIQVLSNNLAIPIRVQELMASMISLFDVEVAIGDQLDIIGKWVGVSRNVKIPIPNVYFSWDGVNDFLGWEFGTWQPANAPASVTVLPDDAYRILLKAKIAANQWDGTTEGAYTIWEAIFTGLNILIQDNQDMSYDLIIVGGTIDSLTAALLVGGYIPLKPEGVKVNNYYVPIDDGPAFGWDVESAYISGWDEGSWTKALITS
jgi:hypothetical protein